jgi:hypothetical protein
MACGRVADPSVNKQRLFFDADLPLRLGELVRGSGSGIADISACV